MPEDRAKAVFDKWRSALDSRVETARRRYRRSYPAGTPILDIHETISSAGWDAAGRPRLVAAPAADVAVRATWSAPYLCFEAQSSTLEVRMPPRNDGSVPFRAWCTVPPALERGECMVLWEPDWGPYPARLAPLILHHLDGPLWVVVHQHELSAVETAAISS